MMPLQVCASISIANEARDTRDLHAYLLIESWLFTVLDLFAQERVKAETSR